LLEVVGRASSVHSTKRTTEVIPVGLAEAEEEESSSGSSEMVSEDVRGVLLQWQEMSENQFHLSDIINL
jgi:hypothetical protein